MDFDLIFVAGLIAAAFSVPTIIAALTDKRKPRLGLLLLVAGLGGAAYAVYTDPETYTVEAIPDVFVRVVGTYIN